MRRVWLETSFAVAKRVVNRGWHTFALAKGYSARNAIPRVVDLPSVASSTTTFPLFSFLSSSPSPPTSVHSTQRLSSSLFSSFLILLAFPSFLFCYSQLSSARVLRQLFHILFRSSPLSVLRAVNPSFHWSVLDF